MKENLHYAIVLAVFAVIAGTSLAITDQLTSERIRQQDQSTKNLEDVLPGATEFSTSPSGYYGYADSKIIGCIYTASGKGYHGTIVTLVGVGMNGTVTGIKVISQQETPGLGSRITEVRPGENTPWFQLQFRGLKPAAILSHKEGGEIDAISGATISSRGVTQSVKEAADRGCKAP